MSTSLTHRRRSSHAQPRPAVMVIGWLTAVWCVAFAVVNVVLEGIDHLADGEYAEYTAAFTVMNWLVVGLKLLGAGIALLSVSRRPSPMSANLLGVAVWGAFATIAVYFLGSLVQAVGMVSGLTGSVSEIDVTDLAYLIFFLPAAIGWGVLASSYARRQALSWHAAALGVLGAPVVLGFLLVAMPALLAAFGFMPSS